MGIEFKKKEKKEKRDRSFRRINLDWNKQLLKNKLFKIIIKAKKGWGGKNFSESKKWSLNKWGGKWVRRQKIDIKWNKLK